MAEQAALLAALNATVESLRALVSAQSTTSASLESTVAELSTNVDGLSSLNTTVEDLSSTVNDALSCDADGRRMQAAHETGADAATTTPPPEPAAAEQPTPSDLEIARDYVAQNPSLAEKMDADELLHHFNGLVEQLFGEPARA